MQISWNWLNTIINLQDVSPYDLGDQLTLRGFEIEDIREVDIKNETDIVFDIALTSNRPDILSLRGLAREIAAITNKNIIIPKTNPLELKTAQDIHFNITNKSQNLYKAYFCARIKNIELKPSPDWLTSLLKGVEIESENLLADVINYILIEYGQPFSVVDLNKLQKYTNTNHLEIQVRHSLDNDEFYNNMDQQIKLSDKNLLVTFNNIPIELAGIKINSKVDVSNSTQDIILQSMVLNPSTVRRSSRSVGMRTESSIRHERGTNIFDWQESCIAIMDLLGKLSNCNIDCTTIFKHEPLSFPVLTFSVDKIFKVLGKTTNSSIVDMVSIVKPLNALGLACSCKDQMLTVSVPEYRLQDIERDIDVIEEIGRLVGFNSFTGRVVYNPVQSLLSGKEIFIRKSRLSLKLLGFTEIITSSFIKEDHSSSLKLYNPWSSEFSNLRGRLLDNMIKVGLYNLMQDNHILECFEIGRVFNSISKQEEDHVAVIMGGNRLKSNWSNLDRKLSWSEAKGILETYLRNLNLDIDYGKYELPVDHANLPSFMHPTRKVAILYNNQVFGYFTKLHPDICKTFGTDLYVFEINLNPVLLSSKSKQETSKSFSMYSQYPIITQDVSLIIPLTISVQNIIKSIKKRRFELLENIEVFDEYQANNIPSGHHSVAFRCSYRSMNDTLLSTEVEDEKKRILAYIQNLFPIQLRE